MANESAVTATGGASMEKQNCEPIDAGVAKTKPESEGPVLADSISQANTLKQESLDALDQLNFEVAIAKSAEALKLIVESTNELSRESAPFYYVYGSVLLEQIRSQSDLFGDSIKAARQAGLEQAAQEAEEEMEDNASAEEQDETNDQDESVPAPSEQSDSAAVKDEVVPQNEETVSPGKKEEEEVDGEEEVNGEEEAAESDNAEEAVKEPEKEPDTSTDMEITWELLETARVIYQRSEDKESRIGLARTLHRLGDFRLENDDINGAIDDYTKALTIRENQLANDDRLIASSHYAIALALVTDKNAEKALDHFVAARTVFARQIARIIGLDIPDTSKESEDPDSQNWRNAYKSISEEKLAEVAAQGMESELKEFVGILTELDNKIEDTELNLKEMSATPETHSNEAVSNMIRNVMAEAAKAAGLGQDSGFAASSSSSAPEQPEVNNLGTIVGSKRKQQVELETEADEPPLKVPKEN